MKLETKKIIILVFSIITIIGAISNLLTAIMFATGLQEYPEIELEGLQTMSPKAMIVAYTVLLISTIIVLILNKNVKKHRVAIILLSMIQFLTGNIIFSSIIIIILSRKTKNENGELEPEIELPVIERTPKKLTGLYLFLFILAIVINYTPVANSIIEWFGNNVSNLSLRALAFSIPILLILGLSSIACIVYPIICMRKELKSDFKVMKSNFKTYMEYVVPRLGIFLIIYYVTSLVLTLIIRETPSNQAAIQDLALWKIALLSLLYAPIVEECLFRGLLKKSFKNNTIFIIASTVIFGAIHVMTPEANPMLYLYVIIYALIGYFLAKTYAKTDNIAVSVLLHFMWNAISFISTALAFI